MRKMLLLSALVCALVAGSCVAQRQVPKPETVMVPLRDGVRLATDLYKPRQGEGPWSY